MTHTRPRRPLALVAVAALVLASLACSVGQTLLGQNGAATEPTRTPVPTFTPLPGQATPLPGAGQGVIGQLPPGVTAQPAEGEGNGGSTSVIFYATPTGGPAPTVPLATRTPVPTLAPSVTPRPTPYVVVSGGAVNVRRGPDESFELLGQAMSGQQLVLLGRTPDDSWWQVCCVANQPGWVLASLVSEQNSVDIVPAAPVPATPTPIPTATATMTPTLTPTPVPPFDIARGPEFPIKRDDGQVVIWVKVYEDSYNPKPLAGYQLKVFRNNVDVSTGQLSHNRSSGFDDTGPAQGNFEYNLKFEMKGGEADWQIYLARPDGSRVSPVSKFTTMGDSYRNLVVYVAYFLAR